MLESISDAVFESTSLVGVYDMVHVDVAEEFDRAALLAEPEREGALTYPALHNNVAPRALDKVHRPHAFRPVTVERVNNSLQLIYGSESFTRFTNFTHHLLSV